LSGEKRKYALGGVRQNLLCQPRQGGSDSSDFEHCLDWGHEAKLGDDQVTVQSASSQVTGFGGEIEGLYKRGRKETSWTTNKRHPGTLEG